MSNWSCFGIHNGGEELWHSLKLPESESRFPHEVVVEAGGGVSGSASLGAGSALVPCNEAL
eukprot:3362787-Prorocentrum_lima.AAC.1